MLATNGKSLTEIVNSVKKEEPVLITPEVGVLIPECLYLGYEGFTEFDKCTRRMEGFYLDVKELMEVYARRLLAAFYFRSQIGSRGIADKDTIFALDRAGSASNGLVRLTSDVSPFWMFRSALTRLLSAGLSESRHSYQDAFFSNTFVADSALMLLEYGRDLSVIPGFSHNRVLDIFMKAVEKMNDFSRYVSTYSLNIFGMQKRVSIAYKRFAESSRLSVHA